MKNATEIHINFKGGIVSPGNLLEILEIARTAGIADVRFGLRQQLILHVPGKSFEAFEDACHLKKIVFEKGKKKSPNIVSSYAAADIFTKESWLREGVYKDVFDLFYYKPALKINVCDSQQHLVPFFTGHLNWLSAPHQHFWYLYIRFPHTGKAICWPDLVYTNDIATVSKKVEELILQKATQVVADTLYDFSSMVRQLKDGVKYVAKPVEDTIAFKTFYFPYYEGLNKEGANNWLGIYRRDELFSVAFLLDICNICLQTKIGQLYTTPWKSLIVKGIENTHRHLWDYVLGKHRINIRHAANELNWQVEDSTDEGLVIKRHIIRHFDKEDVRTYGLIFAVETTPASNMFGSVIIRLRQNNKSNRLKSMERFDILHTKDFNPNSNELVVYRENVEKDYIGVYLVSLCKYFYESQSSAGQITQLAAIAKPISLATEKAKLIYQCKNCFTVYDEAIGDLENGISPGSCFDALPAGYCCQLCGAPKEDLVEMLEKNFQSMAF